MEIWTDGRQLDPVCLPQPPPADKQSAMAQFKDVHTVSLWYNEIKQTHKLSKRTTEKRQVEQIRSELFKCAFGSVCAHNVDKPGKSEETNHKLAEKNQKNTQITFCT